MSESPIGNRGEISPIHKQDFIEYSEATTSNNYNSNLKGDKSKDLNSFIENELSQLTLPGKNKAQTFITKGRTSIMACMRKKDAPASLSEITEQSEFGKRKKSKSDKNFA